MKLRKEIGGNMFLDVYKSLHESELEIGTNERKKLKGKIGYIVS